jgi:two-component system chemotaxis response regulator CheY
MSQDSRYRVLLVDDSLVTLKAHEKFLAGTEFEVVGTARGGLAGINAFKELRPDLVVLDIVMPDVDGVETLRGIFAEVSDACVVMVSSLGTREKVMQSLALGARGFLTKPYQQAEFLKTLRHVTGESHS